MRQDQYPNYNPEFRGDRWSDRRDDYRSSDRYRPDEDYERRAFDDRGGRQSDDGFMGRTYRSPNFDAKHEDRAGFGERYRFGDVDDQRFHNEDSEHRIPVDETSRLIASDKVEGTPVFDTRGERIGTIENFMVTKRSGRVEYAVLSFGGFMGLGEQHYPLEWDELTYDERLGGYVISLSREQLLDRPRSKRWAFM